MKQNPAKRMFIWFLTILMLLSLAACTKPSTTESQTTQPAETVSASKTEDASKTDKTDSAPAAEETDTKTYSVMLDPGIAQGDWFPVWMFFKKNVFIQMLQVGGIWTLDLTVQGDAYTLTSYYYNSDETMQPGDASYFNVKSILTGKCQTDGNTIIAQKAETAEYSVGYGDFMAPYIDGYSFGTSDADYAGTWTEKTVPDILDALSCVTTFTVDGDRIVDYTVDRTDVSMPEAETQPAETVEKTAAFEVASTGGKTFLAFYADGSYTFSFPTASVTEDGTWTLSDGVLTLTTPKGVSFTPESVDGDAATYAFVTDLNAQLGGTFVINMTAFSEAFADMPVSYEVTSTGGKTFIEFRSDGSYTFTFPMASVSEDGTWTLSDGVLTLTTPKGVSFTPVSVEGDEATYQFATDLNAQLGGTFVINLKEFESVLG